MLSRIFLILAGLFAGLWLQDGSGTLLNLGYPALSLVALLFAIAATPPSLYKDATGLENAYRAWLAAWHRHRSDAEPDRHATELELAIASGAVALLAPDRVGKSLQAAKAAGFSPATVAALVLDMRRSLRRAGVSLRTADLEALLTAAPAPTNGRPAPTRAPSPASFLG